MVTWTEELGPVSSSGEHVMTKPTATQLIIAQNTSTIMAQWRRAAGATKNMHEFQAPSGTLLSRIGYDGIWHGPINVGSLSAFTFPKSSTPTQTALGQAIFDSGTFELTIGDGTSRRRMVNLSGAQSLTGTKTMKTPIMNTPVTWAGTFHSPSVGTPTTHVGTFGTPTIWAGTQHSPILNTPTTHVGTFGTPTVTAFTNAQHTHVSAAQGGALTMQAIPGTFSALVESVGFSTTSVSYVHNTALGTITIADPGYAYVVECKFHGVIGSNTNSEKCFVTFAIDGVTQEAITEGWRISGTSNQYQQVTISACFNVAAGAARTFRVYVKSSNAAATASCGAGLLERMEVRIIGRQ